MGKLYGIGVGPGDPELLTLKALRLVKEAEVIALPGQVPEDTVAFKIVEGAYPESLSYLKEHYGLTVNEKDYIITYEVFASNQMPDVQVLVRGEER